MKGVETSGVSRLCLPVLPVCLPYTVYGSVSIEDGASLSDLAVQYIARMGHISTASTENLNALLNR
jgi:hypothetical protein